MNSYYLTESCLPCRDKARNPLNTSAACGAYMQAKPPIWCRKLVSDMLTQLYLLRVSMLVTKVFCFTYTKLTKPTIKSAYDYIGAHALHAMGILCYFHVNRRQRVIGQSPRIGYCFGLRRNDKESVDIEGRQGHTGGVELVSVSTVSIKLNQMMAIRLSGRMQGHVD